MNIRWHHGGEGEEKGSEGRGLRHPTHEHRSAHRHKQVAATFESMYTTVRLTGALQILHFKILLVEVLRFLMCA